MSQKLPLITAVINAVTDYMIEHGIRSDRLRGFKSVADLGAMGSGFHLFVYHQLRTLPAEDQVKALNILKGIDI